ACTDPVVPPIVPTTHDLVFEGYLSGTAELLVWDSEADSVRRLLPPGMVVMDPEPSPDGSRIAFVVADYPSGTGDIFVMDRDGGNVDQITFDDELQDQPSWSPDGTRIAYRSYASQLSGDIWIMDADGGSAVNITPDPLPAVTEERNPSWSPDGTRIAYASNAGGNTDIWVMAQDGSEKLRITNTADLDVEPAWSPDGVLLAFRRSSNISGSDIHLIATTGGPTTPLVHPGEQRMPVWSPDGTRLVVVGSATVGARPDLYTMRRNGADLEPLVTDEVPGGSLNPAFLLRP
ncbi:MAG: hypothetical protein ABL963_11540, partial [Longimicrobiales bacterium]